MAEQKPAQCSSPTALEQLNVVMLCTVILLPLPHFAGIADMQQRLPSGRNSQRGFGVVNAALRHAEALLRESLDMRRSDPDLGPEHPKAKESQKRLRSLLQAKGRLDEAEALTASGRVMQ